MKAYILVTIQPGKIQEVVSHLERLEHVIDANMTFGPYDAVAVVQGRDVNHLGHILASSIQPIPGIQETLTCLAIQPHK